MKGTLEILTQTSYLESRRIGLVDGTTVGGVENRWGEADDFACDRLEIEADVTDMLEIGASRPSTAIMWSDS